MHPGGPHNPYASPGGRSGPLPHGSPPDDEAVLRASQAPSIKMAGFALFFAGATAIGVVLQFTLVITSGPAWAYALQGLLGASALACIGAGLKVLTKSLVAARVAACASAAQCLLGLAWFVAALTHGFVSPMAFFAPVLGGAALGVTLFALPHLRLLARAQAELLR